MSSRKFQAEPFFLLFKKQEPAIVYPNKLVTMPLQCIWFDYNITYYTYTYIQTDTYTHTNKAKKYYPLWIRFIYGKSHDIKEISRSFDKNIIREKNERVSIWTDEYRLVSIFGWTTETDFMVDSSVNSLRNTKAVHLKWVL